MPLNDDFAIDPSLLDIDPSLRDGSAGAAHTDGYFNGNPSAQASGHAHEQVGGSARGHVSGQATSSPNAQVYGEVDGEALHVYGYANAQVIGHAHSSDHTVVDNRQPHYPTNGEMNGQPIGQPNRTQDIPATLPPHPHLRFFHGAEQEAKNDPVLALLKTARSTPADIPDYAALLPGPEVRGRPGFLEARAACGEWYDTTRTLALPVTISPEVREYVRLLAPRGKEKVELYERLKSLRQPPPGGYADPAKERKDHMELAVLQAMIEEAQAHTL